MAFRFPIIQDRTRDDLLTPAGKASLLDRYLQEGESFQDMFARVASHFADNAQHAQRLYDYFSKHWAMPATPILSNGGTKRGLPISCFVNESPDSLRGINALWDENIWLAALGGGIGSYWGNVRSIGESIGRNGKTSGVIPFIKVMDSLTLAISQGSLRRGSAAVYLPINHPEIEVFLTMRRPTGGDPNQKALNLHHGVLVTDDFIRAVRNDDTWNLVSPKDGAIIKTVRARDLWQTLLISRIEQGEPYILFIDTVNKYLPTFQKDAGLSVKTSNLCAEIVLPTGIDQYGKDRTAVCCLSSMNLAKWEEWKDDPNIIEDMMRFLDNVLQDFIDNAPPEMEKAKYSAMRERAVGLGVMGFHTFLQSKMVPFGSAIAKAWNRRFFLHIKEAVDKASHKLALERGACPDAEDFGVKERFSHKTAIAPTASISCIAGSVSPGIDPITANVFTHKTLSGSTPVRNLHLEKVLERYGKNSPEVWDSVSLNKGSVAHLSFLSVEEKEVFKTAYEIDQRWIIELAGDRAQDVDQSQSVNLFLRPDIHKRDLNQIHLLAHRKGVKSLYYCRSQTLHHAGGHEHGVVSDVAGKDNRPPATNPTQYASVDYEECLSCQ